jgi:hypothetical protein
MSTAWRDEIECPGCEGVGTAFWGEGGYHDRDEWFTEIWGDFRVAPSPSPSWAPRSKGEAVCRRCGISPRVIERVMGQPAEERRRWCRG